MKRKGPKVVRERKNGGATSSLLQTAAFYAAIFISGCIVTFVLLGALMPTVDKPQPASARTRAGNSRLNHHH